MTEFDPHDLIRGMPPEPTPFYTWTSYINPDFAHSYGEGDPGTIVLSLCGVQVGDYVIHMCNGTMAINPIDEPPISMNFDQYIEDLLINVGPLQDHAPRLVVFDPQTERYTPEALPPPQVHWVKKED